MIKFKSETWLNASDLRKAVAEATIEPTRLCAISVEREAKASMKQGGKIARADGKGYLTEGQPSAPGTPPHVQHGTLRGSIRYEPIEGARGTYYIVGPTSPPAWYGVVHEFGGRFHPPRPFMRPALARVAPRFPMVFRDLPIAETPSGKKMERAVKAWQKRWQGRS